MRSGLGVRGDLGVSVFRLGRLSLHVLVCAHRWSLLSKILPLEDWVILIANAAACCFAACLPSERCCSVSECLRFHCVHCELNCATGACLCLDVAVLVAELTWLTAWREAPSEVCLKYACISCGMDDGACQLCHAVSFQLPQISIEWIGATKDNLTQTHSEQHLPAPFQVFQVTTVH
jgi:hypothetical protein